MAYLSPLGLQLKVSLMWLCPHFQTTNQPRLVRFSLGFVHSKSNKSSFSCCVFLNGLFCFCVVFCVEGEVCQTAGSAAQLSEDRPVYVPGTDCFTLSSQIQNCLCEHVWEYLFFVARLR